jgi:RecA-family ATPase
MDLQSESTTNLSDNAQIASGSVLSLKPESGHFTHEIGQSLKKINLQDDPVEFIAGMFPKGKVSALVGESGKGKGWVLPAVALTITDAIPFLLTLDYELKKTGKVLIVDTEGRIKTYCQRIIELGGNLDNYLTPCHYSKISGFQSKKDREMIEEVIKLKKIELVIVDSFAGFSAVDENTSAVLPALKWFVEIALKFNVAVVFTQLANKTELRDGRLTLKSVRGYSGIHQFPEIIWALDTPDSNNDKLKRLYQLKNNVEQKDLKDYLFILDKSKITFTEEQVESQKTKIAKRQDILEANREKNPAAIARLIQEIEPDTKLNSLTVWVERNLQ